MEALTCFPKGGKYDIFWCFSRKKIGPWRRRDWIEEPLIFWWIFNSVQIMPQKAPKKSKLGAEESPVKRAGRKRTSQKLTDQLQKHE